MAFPFTKGLDHTEMLQNILGSPITHEELHDEVDEPVSLPTLVCLVDRWLNGTVLQEDLGSSPALS